MNSANRPELVEIPIELGLAMMAAYALRGSLETASVAIGVAKIGGGKEDASG